MDDDLFVLDRVESASCDCAGISVLTEPEETTCDAEFVPNAPTDASDANDPPAPAESAEPTTAELSAPRAPESPPVDQIVEALLFSADAPLSLNRLAELAGCAPLAARLAVADLNARYTLAKLSFRIEEIARGYQMMTLPRFQPWLAKLTAQRAQTRLSPAALETVSIIAYKQPIIRADVEAIRGVAAGEVLNRLREMGLVRIVGRAEVVGRPLLYGTTKKFLDVFGLADLDDLPPLEALNLRRRSWNSEAPATAEANPEPRVATSAECVQLPTEPSCEPPLAASA
jgi:segregation and condensation protein B